jgi:hypothetical protein
VFLPLARPRTRIRAGDARPAPDEQEDAMTTDLKGAITDQKMMGRTPIELAAFAAWINVAPTEVPDAYTSHVNSSTMAAWKRVADAVARAAAPDMADRIKALEEALRSIERAISHPVSTQINSKGYGLRPCSPDLVEVVFDRVRAALNGDET